MDRPDDAPSITLKESKLIIEWGRSQLDVHVDDARALAKMLEGVGLMAGDGAPRELDGPSISHVANALGGSDSLGPKKKRRKSRKNVGDALVIWMSAHPGWHSEEALLETVIAHRMSDAEPKRALKIALGRKKDEVFVTDGLGNWQLKEDVVRQTPPGFIQRDEGGNDSRWDSSSAQEIARARKNLLGGS